MPSPVWPWAPPTPAPRWPASTTIIRPSPAPWRTLQHADAAKLAGAGHAYQLRDVIVDADGSEHVRFARSFQGLPVIGGDLVVHGTAQGALRHISQTLKSAPALDIRPTVGEAEAIARATSAFDGALKAPATARLAVVCPRREAAPGLRREDRWRARQRQPVDRPPDRRRPLGPRAGPLDDIHTADAVGTGNSLYSGTVSIIPTARPAALPCGM